MARREKASIEEEADRIVRQLGGKWQGDFAMCRCPAHADGKASLSIRTRIRARAVRSRSPPSQREKIAVWRISIMPICIPKDTFGQA